MLVIDPNPNTAKMLAEFLRTLVPNCQVFGAQTDERALRIIETADPQVIFVEYKGPDVDGLALTKKLRRSDLPGRAIPVIVVTAEATTAAIIGCRDAGVHEFLRRPFNLGDLKKRLDAVVDRPREWVEGINYIGPDRRRFNSADYKGPRKRGPEGASPVAQRIGQAIKIIKAAEGALFSDPKQAMRALRAQVRILGELSSGQESLKDLQSAVLGLASLLQTMGPTQSPTREQIAYFAAQMIAAAPEDVVSRAA
jgi:DNA-binding response OmpR family regulator